MNERILTPETKEVSPEVRKRHRWVLITGAILAVTSAAIFMMQESSIAATAGAQQEQIVVLQDAVQSAQTQRETEVTAGSALSVGAPSGQLDIAVERLSQDREIAEAMLETMFTWESHVEYTDARKILVDKYGVTPDSSVLTKLMPESPVSVDADGKKYPYIDAAGLTSRLGSFSMDPVNVHGTNYSYLVIASVLGSSNDGSHTANRSAVLTVTIDGNETITKLQGWASTEAMKSTKS